MCLIIMKERIRPLLKITTFKVCVAMQEPCIMFLVELIQ